MFRPARHDPRTGGIVVYAHGFRTDIDTAWCEHRLASQFAASGRDALFIAPEVPDGLGVDPQFPELGEVIRVARRAGVLRPWGPVIAVGHSGAYRTMAGWLDYRDLEHVILLDGLYGREDIYLGWLVDPTAPHRRLSIVAADTLRWTEPALAPITENIAVIDQFPARLSEIPEIERRARVHYIKSQFGHMEIVEDGAVIPLMLRLTGLASRTR